MKMISTSDAIIIGTLADKSAHATGLALMLHEKVGVKVGTSKGAIYAKLRRMEEMKLLRSAWKKPTKVQNGCRVYRVAPAGEKAFLNFLNALKHALM